MAIKEIDPNSDQIATGLFEPQIVIEIKGYPLLCTGDSLLIDERLKGINTPDYYPYIDLDGSQKTVSQQLALDKGGSSSTAVFKAKVIDKDEVFTSLFSYVTNNMEILETEARVYHGIKGGLFPRDFSPFINGTIGNTAAGHGYWDISINHPDKNKKQKIFSPKSASLVGAIDDVTTTLIFDDLSEFHLPTTDFRTFIRIEDEIIEYFGISGDSLLGVIRAQLDTIAEAHDDDAEASSFYELSGNSLDLPRRLLLSGSGESEEINISAVNNNGTTTIQNAIFFDQFDIRDLIGASIGDKISMTSITNPGNDFVDRVILDFSKIGDQSYYIVDGAPLITELAPDAKIKVRSQFDILPEGCALKMWQVDQEQFESVETLFSSRFLDFRFYIKDEIDVDEYINEKIYLPSSFYNLPREGKNSVGVFAPPLTSVNTIRIGKDAINKKAIAKVIPKRGTSRHFYNYITYRIDEDSLGDRFTVRRTLFSQDSINRVKAKNKGIVIESGGLRKSSATLLTIANNSDRIIERYRFAAEEIACEVLYSIGVKIEIGDAVIFGDDFIQVTDSSRGDRKFRPRIMQVINRSVNYFNGKVSLILLDTSYSIFARFGIISPASKVLTITDGNKFLTTPYCPSVIDTETETWECFIGTRVKLRLPDFSYNEDFLLEAVIGGELILNPAPVLPSFPSNNGIPGAFNKDYLATDLILESINYPDNDIFTDQLIWKDTYVYFNPRLVITNVIDESNIEVSASDISDVLEKAFLVIHSPDFTDSSQEVTVKEVNSNRITTSAPLTYLPAVGDEIDLVGFLDGGYPYRYF